MDYGTSFLIAVGLIAFGRIYGSAALKKLPEQQQAAVQAAFVKIRGHVFVPVLVIVFAVFSADSFFKANTIYAVLAIALYSIYMVLVYLLTVRKMAENDIPSGYKTSFLISFYASQVGVLVLLVGYLL